MGESSDKSVKNKVKQYIFLRELLVFWNERANHEWIALVALFWRATRVIGYSHSFVESNKNNLLTVALFLRAQEWIAQGCALKIAILSKKAKSEEQKSKGAKEQIPNTDKISCRNSNSLMVTLLWRVTGAICSRSLFFKYQLERFAPAAL